MARRWVADASPLILLGKIDQATLLRQLTDELVIPDAVAREVGARPEGRRVLEELTRLGGVEIASHLNLDLQIEVWDLGSGESQVLALARAAPGGRAVLDDREARRCAQALGLPIIGTLGVVLRAKRQGLIGEARPMIEDLRRAGLYLTDEIVEGALAHLGEATGP
jgi:predicted nucleic acid-binding protein